MNDKDEKIVTTVVLSLEALINYMQSVLPGVSFVYDENLGYESSMEALRAANNLRDGFENKLPAFFFRRSILRYSDKGQGRRSVVNRMSAPGDTPGDARVYRSIYGVYDVDFNFVAPRMSDVENFEVSWMSESGLPNIKDLDVEVPTIGSLPYHVSFEPLDEKIVNSQGSYFKSLVGRMAVTGTFLAFKDNAKLIKEINAKTQTFSSVILGQQTITE